MRTLVFGLPLVLACTVTLTVDATLYRRPSQGQRVEAAPPPLEDDTADPGQPPELGSVWVSGHWEWEGRWTWKPGRWAKPREGHVWEPPVCVARDGVYYYHPGFFRPADDDPPPEYRAPGQIQLHVPVGVRPAVPDRVLVRPGQPAPDNTPQIERPTVNPNPGGEDPSLQPGNPNLEPRPGGDGLETGDGTQSPGVLRCELAIARVPRTQARATINGEGFTDDTVVTIGGQTQVIRTMRPTSLQVDADRGGAVVVVRGNDRAECGALELF